MPDFTQQCFVCGSEIDPHHVKINNQLNLPVCGECSETDNEKAAVSDLFEGMADGFVCGCI